MSSNEELILGGFDHDSSSDSDSELSETWSELGAQIFDNEGPLFSTQAQYDPDGRMDDFKYENLLDEEIQNNGEESNTSIPMDIKVDELILDGEDNTLGQVDFEKRKTRQNLNSSLNQVLHLNKNSQKIPKKIISSNSRNLRSAGKNFVATKSFQNIVYNKDNSAKPSSFSNPYPYLCDGCKRKFVNLEDYKSHIKNVGMNCQNPILFLNKSRDINSTNIRKLRNDSTLYTNEKTLKSSANICTHCPRSRSYFSNYANLKKHIEDFHYFNPKTSTSNSTTETRSNENEEQSTVTGPNFSPKISDDNIDQIIELVVKGQGSELFDILFHRKRKKAELDRKLIAKETEDQRARRLDNVKNNRRKRISVETEEQRARRLENDRKRKRERIANETEEQRVRRLENQRLFYARKALTLGTEYQKLTNRRQKQTLQDLGQVQKFTCDKCQIDFSKLYYLSNHNKKNHPEIYLESIKHVCEICGKLFKYSSDLHLHKKIHGEKIYSCPFEDCTKSFALEKYVKDHISRFHSSTSGQPREKVYLCETCGQGFSNSKYFNLHKKEHSRLLHLRKQAYENKIRLENPSKNDQEIKDILSKFWESRESLDLKSAPETLVEKKARNRLQYIENIEKKGLQKLNESIEECLERLRKERIDDKRRKRESETEEERTARRIKYRKGFNTWKNKNKEEYNKKQREYLRERNKFKPIDKNSEKYKNLLAKNRENWAKKPPEKKAKRLESMKKYQQSKKKLD